MFSNIPTTCRVTCAAVTVIIAASSLPAQESNSQVSIRIGGRLELFVDRHLVDTMKNVDIRMHEPCQQPLPQNPLPVSYTTVIKDGEVYRAYFRDYVPGYEGPHADGNPGEITCYAESRDGREWTFPDLGVTDVKSARGGNVILAGASPCSHNFSPFLDTRPGVRPDARFKALAGTYPGGGLYAFTSADGVRWKKMQSPPVIQSRAFAFDSQNVSFWSEAESCYVCYFRTWATPHAEWDTLRSINRVTSDDFVSWSRPVAMNPNLPGEHLYVSQTHPYFRAPHIYVALPTRFVPERGKSTDILFMATRAGAYRYDRLFTEAFLRPGMDPARWGNRSNFVALNVVPTGRAEMSIYHSSGYRYVLRTDGFVSVRAGAAQGELLTRPITFAGSALYVNFSTSAAGGLQVEVQDARGAPLPGFKLSDCAAIVGDRIKQRVEWKGAPNVNAVGGNAVRLRFVMRECDLYSFQFGSE